MHGLIVLLMGAFSVMYRLPGGLWSWAFVVFVSAAMVFIFSSGAFSPSAWLKLLKKKKSHEKHFDNVMPSTDIRA